MSTIPVLGYDCVLLILTKDVKQKKNWFKGLQLTNMSMV